MDAAFERGIELLSRLCGDSYRGVLNRQGACWSRHRHGPHILDQAALTSIILGTAARGAGALTSSMPFA
jgi:hypothetical protein